MCLLPGLDLIFFSQFVSHFPLLVITKNQNFFVKFTNFGRQKKIMKSFHFSFLKCLIFNDMAGFTRQIRTV